MGAEKTLMESENHFGATRCLSSRQWLSRRKNAIFQTVMVLGKLVCPPGLGRCVGSFYPDIRTLGMGCSLFISARAIFCLQVMAWTAKMTIFLESMCDYSGRLIQYTQGELQFHSPDIHWRTCHETKSIEHSGRSHGHHLSHY